MKIKIVLENLVLTLETYPCTWELKHGGEVLRRLWMQIIFLVTETAVSATLK